MYAQRVLSNLRNIKNLSCIYEGSQRKKGKPARLCTLRKTSTLGTQKIRMHSKDTTIKKIATLIVVDSSLYSHGQNREAISRSNDAARANESAENDALAVNTASETAFAISFHARYNNTYI